MTFYQTRRLAAQTYIKKYIERWGGRVVDLNWPRSVLRSSPWRTPYAFDFDLQAVGIHVAPFYADHAEDGFPSAIDVPRGIVYIPKGTEDPYLLIHEYAHIVLETLCDSPVQHHDEGELMAAFEGYSVEYLARQTGHVSGEDWIEWRKQTSDQDTEYRLALAMKDWRHELLDLYLFYEKDGLLEPGFWNLFSHVR